MFAAGAKQAGGANRWHHFRSVTPLDNTHAGSDEAVTQ